MNAIFLDRDGVLNKAIVKSGKPYAPRMIDEIVIEEQTIIDLAKLKLAGLILIVITNQPDVANGLMQESEAKEIHEFIMNYLNIEHSYICFHNEAAECGCRKPKAGLILRAASDLGINLHKSFLIGDRWKDIQAGQSAGCKSYFIDRHYNEKLPNEPYTRVHSLTEAAQLILESN
ncbi:MAG: hypothetical protein RL129_106 [Actinomycetota bacterium]|jgi:D-glycero-D-manno-heptose 1,7-bisphosphate phosphatase